MGICRTENGKASHSSDTWRLVASSDLQKHTRWNDTVKWAQNNGCAELIPELNSHEKYEVDKMTTVVESYFDDLGEDDSESN